MNPGSLLQRTDGGLQFLVGSINGPANCRMTASGDRSGHSLFTTEERHKSVSIHDQNGHRLEAADCPAFHSSDRKRGNSSHAASDQGLG
jgi:hypothetical protein